jgi:hypothetical protein
MRLSRAIFIALMIMLGITGCTTSTPSNGTPTNSQTNASSKQPQANNTQQPAATELPKQEQPTEKQEEEIKQKDVILVFSDDNLMENYKEIRSIKYKKEENLPTIALQAWKNGPQNKHLVSLLPKNVTIQSLKKEGDTAIVSLSPEIKQANLGSTGEEMLLQQLATILSQFGYKNTKVVIDGKEVDTLTGHMDTTAPIEPLNINEIKEMKE